MSTNSIDIKAQLIAYKASGSTEHMQKRLWLVVRRNATVRRGENPDCSKTVVAGEVAERLMAPVLKTGIPERVSGVRIPPSPPDSQLNLFSSPAKGLLSKSTEERL